jgi:peptidoglycan/LPS O-acetylase OafA/YrhL
MLAPGQKNVAPWLLPDALKLNNIDFLRFFLASLVIFAHCYALPTGSDATEPLFRFSGGQRTFGGVAVDFFFILSGFLITHSWLRSSGLRSFLWKRVLRIYPAFIAATLFGFFVVVPLFSGRGQDLLHALSIPRFIQSIATLDGGGSDTALARLVGGRTDLGFSSNPVTAINGSLWSIRYEFWCYMGVATLGLLAILAKRPRLMLPLFALAIVASVVLEASGMYVGLGRFEPYVGEVSTWARLFPCYLAGMVFYLFRDKVPWHPALFVAAVAILIAACKVPHVMAAASPIAGTYVLFSLAFLPSLKLQHFGKFGDFSYGIYVYAFPIQQAIVAKLGVDIPLWKFFPLAFLVTLVVAIISWHAIESPCLRLKKRAKPLSQPTSV